MVLSEALVSTMTAITPDRCVFCEPIAPGGDLLIRRGLGWPAGVVGSARLSGAADALGGYTLLLNGPVVVEDLRVFRQFATDSMLTEHKVLGALTLPVRGRHGALGMLGAFSTTRRLFAPDEVQFLLGVANAVAAAAYRCRARTCS